MEKGVCCNFFCLLYVFLPLFCFFFSWNWYNSIGFLINFNQLIYWAAGQVLKCKGWNNQENQVAVSMISKRQLLMHPHVGSINERFVAFNRKESDKYLVNAASEHPFESEPSNSPLKALQGSLDAFYRFSRPHTVIGTVRFKELITLSWHYYTNSNYFKYLVCVSVCTHTHTHTQTMSSDFVRTIVNFLCFSVSRYWA